MAYWITQTGFEPFNDTSDYYGHTLKASAAVSGGMDTSAIDNYREGTNLRTMIDLYRSTQVKISVLDGSQELTVKPNGKLTHQSTLQTYGQAVSIVQFTGNSLFNDSIQGVEGFRVQQNGIRRAATVDYLVKSGLVVEGLMDAAEVFPLYMNGGPQYIEEAIIEPFVIPNRLPSNESPQEVSRGIFAFLEAGNFGDERRFGSSRNEQMVDREQPRVVRPYLEEGAANIIIKDLAGNVVKVVQTRPSYIPDQTKEAKISPWLDEDQNKYMPRFTNTLDLLQSCVGGKALYTRNYGTDSTEIQSRDQKSSTAGFSYYGPNAGYYGTDSVAFGGLLRGS
jgi:hypothetical protein